VELYRGGGGGEDEIAGDWGEDQGLGVGWAEATVG